MMHLTFLKGTSSSYKPAKTYTYKNNGITKVSDYDIGYTFHWNSFNHSEDLSVVVETLRNYALAGWFRINGSPAHALQAQPEVAVRRLSENFPEQSTRLASFDLDGVPVKPELAARHNWDLSDPSSSALVIRDTLTELGLYSLAVSDFIVLFTSSQFTRTKLNCHLYFLFEAPKSLEEMRSMATGFNTFQGAKILDPAPYNPVQPDYIAPPLCTNFADPIPTNARLFYDKGISAMVLEDLFRENLKLVQPVGWSQSGVAEPLAKNWLDSVRLYVGTERGINEPAFRAASQMVHELGRSTVIADLDKYAKQLHDECWDAILAHGVRGDSSDRRTYNVSRFKQYLESATRPGKDFGVEVDKSLEIVVEAINSAAIGNLELITGRQCLSEMLKLRDRYPAAWMRVKSLIKTSLKKIMSVKDVESLLKGMSSTSPLVPGGQPLNPLVAFDNENDMIRPLLNEYQFIKDQNDNMYVKNRNCKAVLPLGGGLVDTFYRDGLLKSNNRVGIAFGKKCISVLMADKDNPTRGSLEFARLTVGKRIIPIGHKITDGTWYNAGVQPDGVHRSIKILPEGPLVFENIDDPVWLPAHENIRPTTQMLEARFPDTDPTPEFLINFFKTYIRQYITCDYEDLPALTSWLVTALTSRPLSYLAEFIGPHNCGKSTGADLAKDLIDPAPQPLGSGAARSVFTGTVDENFFALINSQLITIFDNVGVLTPQTQDVLCQVSTGMRYNMRIMYTQTQLEQYIQRPIILTGISKVITRSDLISRAMTINFTQIPKYDTGFLEGWNRDKPFFFGALLHIVSRVIKMIDEYDPTDGTIVSPRDVVFGAVNSVLDGTSTLNEASVSRMLNDKYADQVLSSHFAKMFVAFIQSKKSGYAPGNTQLMNDFGEWTYNNLGVPVPFSLHLGTYRHDDAVKPSPKALPESMNKLGWAIRKIHHSFNVVSGWYMEERRRSMGKERVFTRKEVLTDLF
jgi:hypothetical protein